MIYNSRFSSHGFFEEGDPANKELNDPNGSEWVILVIRYMCYICHHVMFDQYRITGHQWIPFVVATTTFAATNVNISENLA